MGTYVLVGDDQVPVSPSDVVDTLHQNKGSVKLVAAHYEVSESTLRNFLKANHVTQEKSVYWTLTPRVPAIADEDTAVF